MTNEQANEEFAKLMSFIETDPEVVEAVGAFETAASANPVINGIETANEPEPVKDGLAYAGDVDDTMTGHSLSRYTLTLYGRRILDVLVDNDIERKPSPKFGITLHQIYVAKPNTVTVADAVGTNGVAARTPHSDGVHVDGQTVKTYVLPRVLRLMTLVHGL